MLKMVAQVCAALSVPGTYRLLIYLGAGRPVSLTVAVVMIVAIYFLFRRKSDG